MTTSAADTTRQAAKARRRESFVAAAWRVHQEAFRGFAVATGFMTVMLLAIAGLVAIHPLLSAAPAILCAVVFGGRGALSLVRTTAAARRYLDDER